MTVSDKIETVKRNHQIGQIYLRYASNREELGCFKSKEEIPKDILHRKIENDWDFGYGMLTMSVK